MLKKTLISITLLTICCISFNNEARIIESDPVSRADLNLELDFGNNNGTDTVYDTGGSDLNQTETGTLTFAVTGVDFPGSNNNHFSGTGTGVYNTANCSIMYVFTPDFAANDGSYYVLSDGADANTRYGIFKQAGAQSNSLVAMIGNTVLTTVALATYEDYWLADEKNVLIYSGTTGDNNIWLNGEQIQNSEATAWTPDDPATIYIGSSYIGGSCFDGEMHDFKVWQRLLTAAEIADLSADRIVENDAVSREGMTLEWSFGNNNATDTVYDTGGSDLNGTETGVMVFVEGSDGYVQYTGGGAANHISYSPGTDPIGGGAEISIAVKYRPNFAADDGNNRPVFDSSGTEYSLKRPSDNNLDVTLGGTLIESIATASFEGEWAANETTIFVVVSSATTDRTDFYMNGTQILNQDTTAWAQGAVTQLFGAGGNGSWAGRGNWYYLKVWDRLLTADEVAALSADRIVEISAASRVDLVLGLPMDANDVNGTTVYDKSNEGNNGTTTGSPSTVPAQIKEGIDLDGSSQYITVSDADSLDFSTGEFAVSAWINLDTNAAASQHKTILCKGDPENANEYALQVNGNEVGTLTWRVDAVSDATSTGTISLNTWHHVVATRVGSNVYLYIDGSADGLGASADDLDNSSDVIFGYRNAGYNAYFDGTIDDVRFYSRGLSSAQVSELYEAGR